MMERAVVGLIRFLYRLALFPWLLIQQVAHTTASMTNWLITGQTFEDVERSRRNLDEMKRMFSRKN